MQGLLVCYISGLDLRRIDSETTPFLAETLSSHPWTAYRNLPSNELFPTLVTGVDPTEHGVWGVQIQAGVETNRTRIADCWSSSGAIALDMYSAAQGTR